MGFGDLKDHFLSKVVPGNTQADKIRACSCYSTFLVFFIVFLVGTFSGIALGNDIMFTQLVVNGTSIEGSAGVPFPQIVFCPLLPQGTVENVQCKQIEKSKKGKNKGQIEEITMTPTPLMKGHIPDHPEWGCVGYNLDGSQVLSADHDLECHMDATNKDVINKNPVEWPGLVRVHVDAPGTMDFLNCKDCVDGIDGAILQANSTGFVAWQAHLIDDTGLDFHSLSKGSSHSLLTEYRCVHTQFPRPEVLDSVFEHSITVWLGFYSKDVWRYTSPSKIQGPIGGTRLAQTCTFFGGFIMAGYMFHKLLSTVLILVILGRDQLDSDKTTGYESAPIL